MLLIRNIFPHKIATTKISQIYFMKKNPHLNLILKLFLNYCSSFLDIA